MAIRKLGNKKYSIRVTKNICGRRREKRYTGLFSTMGAVRAKEAELLKELVELKVFEESESHKNTWKIALDEYLAYSEENHRLSTYYNRSKNLEAHTSCFYDNDLSSFSRLMIKEWINSKNCSITHKKEILKYVRQVFELALENRRISFNPARNIKIHGDKNTLSKANSLSAMTIEEVRRVLQYTKDFVPEWYGIFYVTYQLGLRSSEAVALQFSDINWENRQITISKSWCKQKHGFVPPKNGRSRIVPLNDEIFTFLESLYAVRNDDSFILPRNKVWINGGASKVLNTIQKTLGIKRTNYHSLRASFITHLLRSNVDIIRVQAMVGHSDLKTTQRYIRLDATDLVGITSVLELDSI